MSVKTLDNADYILTTSNLAIGYKSGKSENRLMENLNLTIPKKRFIALLGANGVGKSTLIRTLANLHSPLSGSVYLKQKEVKHYNTKEFAQQVSLVLTDPIQSGNLNVKELVEMGRYPYTNWTGRLQEKDHKEVERAIRLCGIEYLQNSNITKISDGQLQKVMIARALAQDGNLMLLDEPTAHLDANNQYMVLELLRNLVNETQKSILISTHQVEIALKLADEVWLANCGDGIICGKPDALISKGEIEKAFPYLKKMKY